MNFPLWLKRLVKRAPKTPAFRPQDSIGTSYRVFTTPAQIQAYTEARFDRLMFEHGDADEPHLVEPGKKVRAIGFLDLTSEPPVSMACLGGLDTARPPAFAFASASPERRKRRLRDGD